MNEALVSGMGPNRGNLWQRGRLEANGQDKRLDSPPVARVHLALWGCGTPCGMGRFGGADDQKCQADAAAEQLFAILENSETPSVRTWRAFIMIAKSRSIS